MNYIDADTLAQEQIPECVASPFLVAYRTLGAALAFGINDFGQIVGQSANSSTGTVRPFSKWMKNST